MSSSVFWALVRKDLYLQRGIMIVTVLSCLLALVITSFGKIGFAVGGILFLTADIAGGIFIAMYCLMGERKSLSYLFALSLPISGFRYDVSKLVSGFLAYGIPWLVLTGIAGSLFLLPGQDRGMIVYVLLLQMFVLTLFSVMLAVLFAVKSELMSSAVIVVVNICFSLFVVDLNLPQNAQPLHGPTLLFTPFAITALCVDVGVMAFTITLALALLSRRRDYF